MKPTKNNKTRNRILRTAALEKLGRRSSGHASKAFNVFTGKYKNLENGN